MVAEMMIKRSKVRRGKYIPFWLHCPRIKTINNPLEATRVQAESERILLHVIEKYKKKIFFLMVSYDS
jgi:hypothetical protein